MADIIPVTITYYNDSVHTLDLALATTSSEVLLDNPSEYQVCVRKVEVPVNSKTMPINSTRSSFSVKIFNEYKEVDRVIPGLVYGINSFEIPGPIWSVKDFISQLNDIVFKKPSPVELGYFVLRADNEIVYRYNTQHANEHDMIKIYFDAKLRRLFDFNYDPADAIDEHWRFKAVESYTPTPAVNVVEVEANSFTFPLFFNLKSIRVTTSLPISEHRVYSMRGRASTAEQSMLLADIAYNSVQMYENTNLIFIPSTLSFCSINDSSALKGFRLDFRYFYADGTEETIKMAPLDYAMIALTFEKK